LAYDKSVKEIELGGGRNDGVNRLIINTEISGEMEYTWNGSS
jgi:hypothetical protein